VITKNGTKKDSGNGTGSGKLGAGFVLLHIKPVHSRNMIRSNGSMTHHSGEPGWIMERDVGNSYIKAPWKSVVKKKFSQPPCGGERAGKRGPFFSTYFK